MTHLLMFQSIHSCKGYYNSSQHASCKQQIKQLISLTSKKTCFRETEMNTKEGNILVSRINYDIWMILQRCATLGQFFSRFLLFSRN